MMILSGLLRITVEGLVRSAWTPGRGVMFGIHADIPASIRKAAETAYEDHGRCG